MLVLLNYVMKLAVGDKEDYDSTQGNRNNIFVCHGKTFVQPWEIMLE
jgi:hypothetical protein